MIIIIVIINIIIINIIIINIIIINVIIVNIIMAGCCIALVLHVTSRMFTAYYTFPGDPFVSIIAGIEKQSLRSVK